MLNGNLVSETMLIWKNARRTHICIGDGERIMYGSYLKFFEGRSKSNVTHHRKSWKKIRNNLEKLGFIRDVILYWLHGHPFG